MDYNPYANYADLLNSQHESVTSLDSPPVHVARAEGTEDSCFGDTPAERRERRTWTPTDDMVLSLLVDGQVDPTSRVFLS